MELSINNVTKQFKDKWCLWVAWSQWCGENNVDENVMYTDNTRLWNDHMGWKRYL